MKRSWKALISSALLFAFVFSMFSYEKVSAATSYKKLEPKESVSIGANTYYLDYAGVQRVIKKKNKKGTTTLIKGVTGIAKAGSSSFYFSKENSVKKYNIKTKKSALLYSAKKSERILYLLGSYKGKLYSISERTSKDVSVCGICVTDIKKKSTKWIKIKDYLTSNKGMIEIYGDTICVRWSADVVQSDLAIVSTSGKNYKYLGRNPQVDIKDGWLYYLKGTEIEADSFTINRMNLATGSTESLTSELYYPYSWVELALSGNGIFGLFRPYMPDTGVKNVIAYINEDGTVNELYSDYDFPIYQGSDGEHFTYSVNDEDLVFDADGNRV